ncbi:TPA_asm: hypothetical protein G3282_003468, partial [Salmonella enterica subsp. enterica serovar Heidelberg]|nr:hypothetical protein [Salmonella enterica subsp. enterica serovar Heidelberg]HAE5974658.1 hypothetical protein [Salmonella enterica subsp. enterica serovar Agona]
SHLLLCWARRRLTHEGCWRVLQQNRSFMNGLVGLFIEVLHQKMYQMKLFANHINFKICLLLSDDVLPRVTKK